MLSIHLARSINTPSLNPKSPTQHARHAQRLHHRSDDDRASGDDFFAVLFEAWQTDAVGLFTAKQGLLQFLHGGEG